MTSPDDSSWVVGRRWFGERQMKALQWRRAASTDLVDGDASVLDVFDGLDLESGLLLFAGVLGVVFIVVPVLLFGVELIIIGAVLSVGVVSRSLLGKPWTIAATRDGTATPAAMWRVTGWRASRELIDQICVDLESRGQLASEFPQAAFIERVE